MPFVEALPAGAGRTGSAEEEHRARTIEQNNAALTGKDFIFCLLNSVSPLKRRDSKPVCRPKANVKERFPETSNKKSGWRTSRPYSQPEQKG